MRSFIADITCSMPKVFTDLQYTLCIYGTGSYWDAHNEWVNDRSMHAYGTCGAGEIEKREGGETEGGGRRHNC
jgi:hypothetical protein